MNRRGFLGRVLGFLSLPFVSKVPLERPMHDTSAGQIIITTCDGVSRRYFPCDKEDEGLYTLSDGEAIDWGDSDAVQA